MHLTSLSGGNSKLEPPDPISNSEVKRLSANGSVGSPHVRVGHRQALIPKYPISNGRVFFCVRDLICPTTKTGHGFCSATAPALLYHLHPCKRPAKPTYITSM